jgi:PAS domain S-box-containing protein
MSGPESPSSAKSEIAALVSTGLRKSDMALLLLDEAGLVLTASRGAEILFGCEPDQLQGIDLALRFTEPDELRDLAAGTSGHPDGTAQFEVRHTTGDVLTVEIHVSDFECTGARHSLLLVRDTRIRQHEDELRAARLTKLSLLNQVSEALYGAQLNLDQILQAVLVCMTAGQGLRFNRALLLLVDPKTESLQGEMAIGPSNADEALRIWHNLADQSSDLFEMVTSYDQSIKQTDVAVNDIVRHMSIPLNDEENILIRTMSEGHVRSVGGETDQPGVETLRHWLGCHEFAIAPMSTRRGPVGVIVADNAISGTTITDQDLDFLQMFANQSAGAIENSRLYTELEQRLSDLHSAHKKQRQDQETLLKMERLSVMGETSAIVAHELRNPLVAIGGFARSLTRGIEAGDPNLVAATIIVEEVARMERIIHDLLDFIRPPKMLRQALVADDIIAQATQKYRPRAEEAEIDLVLDLQADGLVAEMHPGEIQQVLQNFLVNAFQALEGPGRVEVRSRGVEGGIWVCVSDDGPGFDPESVAKLHTPFFSTKPTGSGLGLTICAQIIKAHGGVIEARNRTEGGAEFSFILPRQKPNV